MKRSLILASCRRRNHCAVVNFEARRTSTADVKPLSSILIANRGEIALRVKRTAVKSGIKTVNVYTNPDRQAQHASASPFAVNLGASDQYLNGKRIVEVAKQQECQAIHPGYGFLSENADFARQCSEAGIIFIGPPPSAIQSMGDKARSKEIMTQAGVACIPGYHGSEQSPHYLAERAEDIGYPVLLKAVKGGGGKGMRIADTPEVFHEQLESAKREARSSFGDDTMLVEKYITTPRHIEVQIFADKHGNCVALGERDCSIQRRHQKILEESPAPNLPEEIRQALWETARQAALAVGYEGAGTVEFIFDNDSGGFFFMEMNTRLQVEHPVTEMVTGLDLVQWQIWVAEGRPLPLTQDQVHARIKDRGHAIEARIYAEDPDNNFTPSIGTLHHLRTPIISDDVRVDAGFVEGDEISAFYDPMIAKLIVSGPDRTIALRKLHQALTQYEIAGVVTNIDFLKRCVVSPDFVAGNVETGYIPKHANELFERKSPPIEVWSQAAIAMFLSKQFSKSSSRPTASSFHIGFNKTSYARTFHFVDSANTTSKEQSTEVSVTQIGPDKFHIVAPSLDLDAEVESIFDPQTGKLTSFYPHTRLESTIVDLTADKSGASDHIVLFQAGSSHRLSLLAPAWAAKALGSKETTSSVLAPMPCKIMRVEIQPGQAVSQGQALMVIESMKMETTIRAPSEAIVKRIVKEAGEMAKAGVALVEFEDTSE